MNSQETLGIIIVDGEIIDLDSVPVKKLEQIATKLRDAIEEKRNNLWSQLVNEDEEY